ncbi:MAG: hypothetical protein WBZ36_19280, partial [Candidatus Nitrosopolaris sp.]
IAKEVRLILNNANNTISLKILEAYTRDVGRGVARLDYESMDSLSTSTGDVVEIGGKRRTITKCLPLYPSVTPIYCSSHYVLLHHRLLR